MRDFFDMVMEFAIPAFIVVLLLFVAGIIAIVGFEAFYSYRAEPASIACEAKRGVPLRRSFSSDVTCGLPKLRNDTLTIHGTR